jgi:hypothetical protein
MVRHISPGWMWDRHIPTAAISLPEHAAARQRRFTPTKGNGPEACSTLFAATPQARHLIMREKAEMLFGHLKRISDWTNCACVAKRCERRVPLTTTAQNWGIGKTDPRTHGQSSPHEARRVKLRLARKCRGRTSPSSERGILQRQPPGTAVRGPGAASDAAGARSTRLCDELSWPTRSELTPMNADPPGGPATKLRRTLENPIPRVRTAASNATRCHRAGRFTMMAAPVLLQPDSRLAY